MSSIATFLVETYQGSFVPVVTNLICINEIEDCLIDPLSFSMPFVLLEQAQEFIAATAPAGALVYLTPIKMNERGIKWLSEVERVQ